MGQSSKEILSINKGTGSDAMIHGGVTAAALATASASFGRTLDISAQFDVEANLNGSAGEVISASLEGGLQGHVGARIRAGFPLDLFYGCGLIVQGRLEASASAYVKASVKLELDALRDAIAIDLDPIMSDLLEVFLEEVNVEAGIWARAQFAAAAVGEISILGNLLPSPGTPTPGFSMRLQFGAGLGAGVGYDFLSNIGIEDPRRLYQRLLDRLMVVVEGRSKELELTLGQSNLGPLRCAVRVLNSVLPLAALAAFDVGAGLMPGRGPEGATKSVDTIAADFAKAALEQVLGQVLEEWVVGFQQLFMDSAVLQMLIEADREERQGILAALEGAVISLAEPGVNHSATQVLDAVHSLLAPFDSILGVVATGSEKTEWLKIEGVVWAADFIISHGMGTARPGPPAQLYEFLRESLDGNPVVMGASQAAEYLLSIGPFDQDAKHDGRAALSWILDTLGSASISEALGVLLAGYTGGQGLQADGLSRALAHAVSKALVDNVLPNLLDPLAKADAIAGTVIESVVAPLLDVFASVVLDLPADIQDEDHLLRVREQLSAALLQPLALMVVRTTDSLLHQALEAAGPALVDLGSDIEKSQALKVVCTTIQLALFPNPLALVVTTSTANRLLKLVAKLMTEWDVEHRPAIMQKCQAILAAGMSDTASRQQTLESLRSTNDPPVSNQLGDLADEVARSVWALVELTVAESDEILSGMLTDSFDDAASVLGNAATIGIAAANKAVEELRHQSENLEKWLKELNDEAIRLAAAISEAIGKLAEHLEAIISGILPAIREAGWQILLDVCPDDAEPLLGLALPAYNAMFNLSADLLTAPLGTVAASFYWVHERLLTLIDGNLIAADRIRSELRTYLMELTFPDLAFDVKVYIPAQVSIASFTIGMSTIKELVIDALLSNESIISVLDKLSESGRALSAVNTKKAMAWAQQSGLGALAGAENELKTLTTGIPPKIRIDVVPKKAADRGLSVHIAVLNVSRSYLNRVMDVPTRISLQLNGKEIKYDPNQWVDGDDGSISLTCKIVPSTINLTVEAPLPIMPMHPLELPRGSRLSFDPNGNGHEMKLIFDWKPELLNRALSHPLVKNLTSFGRAPGSGNAGESAERLAHRPVAMATMALSPNMIGPGTEMRLVTEPSPELTIVSPGPTLLGCIGRNILSVMVGDGADNSAAAYVQFYLRSKS
jgi:hypothetical protein